MTHEEVTRWSAVDRQNDLRYGHWTAEECLFGLIDGETTDDYGFHLDRDDELRRACAWQEHNAVAARYAMKELFALIDMRADAAALMALPLPTFLEAAE